jgi:hypothetical protein
MNKSDFEAFVRLLTDGALTRCNLARGLAGIATTTSLCHAGMEDLDAKKRKKGKKRKRRGRGKGDTTGGGVPGEVATLAVVTSPAVAAVAMQAPSRSATASAST